MCSDLQESVGSYEIRKAGCGCAPRIKGNPKCREAAADNAIYIGQEEGRSSTWPSCRTFSSRRSGLALAMQDQAMPWPSLDCVMVHSVSPCRTLFYGTANAGD